MAISIVSFELPSQIFDKFYSQHSLEKVLGDKVKIGSLLPVKHFTSSYLEART